MVRPYGPTKTYLSQWTPYQKFLFSILILPPGLSPSRIKEKIDRGILRIKLNEDGKPILDLDHKGYYKLWRTFYEADEAWEKTV